MLTLNPIDVVIVTRGFRPIPGSLLASLYREIPVNHLIISDRPGVGRARDEALRCVVTPLYVSLDDDVPFLPEGWLASLYSELVADPQAALIVSPPLFGQDNNLVEKFFRIQGRVKKPPSLSAALMWTDRILEVGGFLDMPSGEDVDLKRRIEARGLKWLTCLEAEVLQPRGTLTDYGHIVWWSEGWARDHRTLKPMVRRILRIPGRVAQIFKLSRDPILALYQASRDLVWCLGYCLNFYKHHGLD